MFVEDHDHVVYICDCSKIVGECKCSLNIAKERVVFEFCTHKDPAGPLSKAGAKRRDEHFARVKAAQIENQRRARQENKKRRLAALAEDIVEVPTRVTKKVCDD